MSISQVNQNLLVSDISFHNEVSSFRSVTVDDWGCFRDLRLKALKNAPKAYGIAVEDVETTPDDEWKKLCQEVSDGSGKWYFVAERDGKLIGMLGATEVLWKAYAAPGRNLSRLCGRIFSRKGHYEATFFCVKSPLTAG